MLPTLLIVDDERSTREGLRSALDEEFEVYAAAGTAEALAILKSEPIQVLLTDLRLGGESRSRLAIVLARLRVGHVDGGQALARLARIGRRTDDVDHLVDIGHRDGEPDQHMGAVARLAEQEARAAADDFLAAGFFAFGKRSRGRPSRP